MSAPRETQLPFRFSGNVPVRLDSFLGEGNRLAKRNIRDLVHAEEDAARLICLWGGESCGKTHLLQAACNEAQDLGLRSMYLDLAAPHGSGSILLDGMEQLPLVCLDNLHAVAGQRAWEQAVLRLFEELRARGHRLALAANAPASRLGFCLPDLRTRLQWGLVCQLHPLRDEEKIQAMCRRARMRSFVLPENVAEYLLRNVSRGIRELLDWIDNLDVASLSAQRKVTVPFVRQILRDGAAGGSGRGKGQQAGQGADPDMDPVTGTDFTQ